MLWPKLTSSTNSCTNLDFGALPVLSNWLTSVIKYFGKITFNLELHFLKFHNSSRNTLLKISWTVNVVA